MAIVSAEDPNVLNPGGYFNWLVTTANGIDLAKNLAWLPKHIEQQQQDLDAQDGEQNGGELAGGPLEEAGENARRPDEQAMDDQEDGEEGRDPVEWPQFIAELRRQCAGPNMTDGVFATWFGSLAYLESGNGALALAVESDFIKKKLAERFEQQILRAAKTMGWPVRSVRLVTSS